MEVEIIKNLVLLITAKLMSLLGSKLYGFAMSYYILKLTGSGLAFGLSVAFTALPSAAMAPFAGVIADRFNKKKILINADIASGVIMLVFFTYTHLVPIKVPYIYLSIFLLAVLGSLYETNLSASIPALVGQNLLKKANSLDQSVSSLCNILSPVLGGVIFAMVDIRLFILINGISFWFSAICQSFLKFKHQEDSGKKDSAVPVINALLEGWNYIRSIRFLNLLFVFAIISNFTYHVGFTVCFPYIATSIIGLNSWQFGIARGALSIGSLVTAMIVSLKSGKAEEGEAKYPVVAICGLAITLLFLGAAGLPVLDVPENNLPFLMLFAISFTVGIFIVLVNIPITILIQRVSEEQYLGRVMGLINCSANLAIPAAMLIAGYLVDTIPAFILPIAGGLLLLLAGLRLSSVQSAAGNKNAVEMMED